LVNASVLKKNNKYIHNDGHDRISVCFTTMDVSRTPCIVITASTCYHIIIDVANDIHYYASIESQRMNRMNRVLVSSVDETLLQLMHAIDSIFDVILPKSFFSHRMLFTSLTIQENIVDGSNIMRDMLCYSGKYDSFLSLFSHMKIKNIFLHEKNRALLIVEFDQCNSKIAFQSSYHHLTQKTIDYVRDLFSTFMEMDVSTYKNANIRILGKRLIKIGCTNTLSTSHTIHGMRVYTNAAHFIVVNSRAIQYLRYLRKINGIRSFQRLWRRWWYEPDEEGYVRFASRMYDKDSMDASALV